MALPYFFVKDLAGSTVIMDENASKHIIGVLRMQKGEEVLLTDGKGNKARAEIINDNRKKCELKVIETSKEERPGINIAIGISLTKNSSRFEWFLEKATEIGVTEIIPLQCARTVKEKFRSDRMEQILISAMLQSQQCWMPLLHEPTAFEKALELPFEDKMIAHCEEEEKQQLTSLIHHSNSKLILIGPEGDFTSTEITNALQHGFQPVSLGSTRLRTETAGLVAAALLCSH